MLLVLLGVAAACAPSKVDVYVDAEGNLIQVPVGQAPIRYAGSSAAEPVAVEIERETESPALPQDAASADPSQPSAEDAEPAPERPAVAPLRLRPSSAGPVRGQAEMPVALPPAPEVQSSAAVPAVKAVTPISIPATDECWWSGEDWDVRLLDEATLFFCGVIDSDSVGSVRALLTESGARPKRVVIASAGGKKVWPIEMANLLLSLDVQEIVVAGPCFSGCAHFVFPSVPRRLLLPGGSLGLHNTATSIERMIGLRNRASLDLPQNEALRDRARTEADLIARVGLPSAERFLTDPQPMLETTCVDSVGVDRTGEEIYAYESSYTVWIPPEWQWKAWGVPYEQIGPGTSGAAGDNSQFSELQVTYAPLDGAAVRRFWRERIPYCTPLPEPAAP